MGFELGAVIVVAERMRLAACWHYFLVLTGRITPRDLVNLGCSRSQSCSSFVFLLSISIDVLEPSDSSTIRI